MEEAACPSSLRKLFWQSTVFLLPGFVSSAASAGSTTNDQQPQRRIQEAEVQLLGFFAVAVGHLLYSQQRLFVDCPTSMLGLRPSFALRLESLLTMTTIRPSISRCRVQSGPQPFSPQQASLARGQTLCLNQQTNVAFCGVIIHIIQYANSKHAAFQAKPLPVRLMISRVDLLDALWAHQRVWLSLPVS